MGASGGYKLYKLKDVENPKLMKLIRNWFIANYFYLTSKGTREYRYYDTQKLTMKEWLRKENVSSVEDLTLKVILQHTGDISISVIGAGKLPGLSEDLLRISWGDNVSKEVGELEDIIDYGRCPSIDNGRKSDTANYYSYEELAIYPYERPWTFVEETWT